MRNRQLFDRVGEQVTWTSSNTIKVGKITSFNPSGAKIEDDPVFRQLGIRWERTKVSQSCSQYHRFLIEVPRTGLNGRSLKTHYYCASTMVVCKLMGWE
jgi:hypothetical protein